MSFFSCSSLYRVVKCPASAAMKQNTGRPARVQKAADRGTGIHAYLEDIAIGVPRQVALDRVSSEYRAECRRINTSTLVPFGARAEKAVVYNVFDKTVKIAGYSKGRDYGELVRGDIPGTSDLSWDEGDELWVRDYKTGRLRVQDAGDNDQLKFLALCESILENKDSCSAEIVYISWKEDGSCERDQAKFGQMDFDLYKDLLVEVYERYEGYKDKYEEHGGLEKEDVVKGSWCKYCDARADCPAIKHRKRVKK